MLSNYYREQNKRKRPTVELVTDHKLQAELEQDYARTKRAKNDFSIERGYRQLATEVKQDDKFDVNPSLLTTAEKKTESSSSAFLLERLTDAPKLPVSCIDSTEHVVAMGDAVADFKSPSSPSTKNDVVYRILIKKVAVTAKTLASVIREGDEAIQEGHIKLTSHFNHIAIEIGTQVGDCLSIIQNLVKHGFEIINCDFANIQKNEGICFVDKTTKTKEGGPIHAVVNIASSSHSGKVFLNRDAGSMSGVFHGYTDANWLFFKARDMADLRKQVGFGDERFAVIKITRNAAL